MWARIENGTVAEITDIDPAERFHPSIQWVACDPETQVGWQYDGEVFTPPPATPLADLAAQQRTAIDTSRDKAFTAGMPYTLPDGSDDVVQTRPEDKTNLLGLAVEARDQKAAGETDAVMEFRGESNVTHNLTPQQMIDLTSAALGYIKQVYAQSWDRKDQIDAALKDDSLSDADKRAAIEAISW